MMNNIAVLDDRVDQRETIVRTIRHEMSDDWICLECPLLETVDLYADWLLQNNVSVLVLDQVLNEQMGGGQAGVDYKGHQVIESIRKTFPAFPVWVITAHKDDEDLSEHEEEAEFILTREELTSTPELYITRMMRSGQRFFAEHERQLNELTNLATKAATGTATEQEKQELRTLQQNLGTPKAAGINLTKEAALEEIESKLAELEELRSKVEVLVKNKQK